MLSHASDLRLGGLGWKNLVRKVIETAIFRHKAGAIPFEKSQPGTLDQAPDNSQRYTTFCGQSRNFMLQLRRQGKTKFVIVATAELQVPALFGRQCDHHFRPGQTVEPDLSANM